MRLCSPLCFETIVIVVFPSLCDTFFFLPAFPRGLRQYSCVLSFPRHPAFRGCHTYTNPSLPWGPLGAAKGKKDEGVAVQVGQVWVGGIMLLPGEKAVYFLTKRSVLL